MNRTNAVTEMLDRYAARTATVPEVMRALISYPDWRVPSIRDRDQLWLFSHPEASAGPCAGPIAGWEIFASFAETVRAIQINAGCERHAWHVPEMGLPSTRRLAKAIALEQQLAAKRPGLAAAMRTHGAFFVPIDPQGKPHTLRSFPGMAAAGLVFTAFDAVERYLARHPDSGMAEVCGTELFDKLAWFGIDGLVVNVYGPRAYPLGPQVCRIQMIDEHALPA